VGSDESPSVRYRFGPLERRGLVAGWRGGQIATVGAGLLVAVLVLRADSSFTGALVSLGVVGAAVGVATWPIAGRTIEEWAPDAVRHGSGASRRRAMRRSDPFVTLRLVAVDLVAPAPPASQRERGGGVRSGGASSRDRSRSGSVAAPRRAGVVADVAARTYTAVLSASGAGFVLLGEQDKVQSVGAWAGVLSSLARDGSAVHRVQWVARNTPDASCALAGQLDRAPTKGAVHEDAEVNAEVGGRATAGRSYAALVQAEAAVSRRQEVLLAVTVNAGRASRQVKAAGGGQEGACALVLREAASLRRRLADAGIEAGGALGPQGLALALQRAFATGSGVEAVRSEGAGAGAGSWSGVGAAGGEEWDEWGDRPVSASPEQTARRGRRHSTSRCPWPWPMGVRPEWGRVLVDGTWHATYWISQWPRTEVGPDFLGPLLLLPEVRRAVSVVMEPLGPARAVRRIEQARTADIADSELRRRGGFLATARRRREEEVLAERELELADGHAPFRFSGYVTVSAAHLEELGEACAQTEQAAARCGLELRLCYGDQARAFTATLPLGRGLC
jgi:hypothetical protein